MRISPKTAIAIVCILLITVSAVSGVIAYSTNTKKDVNVMTVGQVKIALDEATVDPQGVPIPDAPRTTEGNNYQLFPGCSYTKDPTVTVKAGSREAYVRALVNVIGYSAVEAALGDRFSPEAWLDGFNPKIWIPFGTPVYDSLSDTMTYELRYVEPVAASSSDAALPPMFTGFTVPGSVTGSQLRIIAEALTPVTVEVKAHAIQREAFAAADDAWAAFDTVP